MGDADRPAFDLIDQPWLVARDASGSASALSVMEVFERADQLADLVGDVPTQVFATTRLLLAILHDAIRGPSDLDAWIELWEADRLPVEDVRSYLEDHRSRFDLLHPVTPFMQVASLRTEKDEVFDPARLIADVPNGHQFFSMRKGLDMSLTFAEAARWLVHCQAYDPSGIKSGAVGDPRVKSGKGYPIGTGWAGQLGGALYEGTTLRETLLLNLIARDFGETARDAMADRPGWAREPDGPAARVRPAPTGPVDLYTWQSRRIRLVAESDRVTKVLICNGDPALPQNRHLSEPLSPWRRSEAQEKKLKAPLVYMPLTHDPEKVIWRGLQALLPARSTRHHSNAAPRLSSAGAEWLALLTTEGPLDHDYPLRIRTIGMTYGSQNATTTEIIDDQINVRAVLLAQNALELQGAVLDCAAAAENAAKALGTLAGNLAAAAGGSNDGPRDRAIESAYAALDSPFRTWLSELTADTDPLTCKQTWQYQARSLVTALGDELLGRAGPAAWVGRLVRQRLLTAAHADRYFHKALRDSLPLAYQEEPVTT